MPEDKTGFKDMEEEKIINTDKIYDFLYFYKIPLIFAVLAVFLLGGAFALWRLERKNSGNIIFSEETSSSASAKIKADIEGAVVKPGVYELVSGSRIQDLLIEAGGLGSEADREWLGKNLNLAAKLVDGGKIYIPTKNTTNNTNTTNTTNNLISVNAASLAQLAQLPGIGPAIAQKIIDNRPYQTLDELVSKKAVAASIFEKIKDKISLY